MIISYNKKTIALALLFISISLFYFGDSKSFFLSLAIPIIVITISLKREQLLIPQPLLWLVFVYALNTILIYFIVVYANYHLESQSRFSIQFIRLFFIFLSIIIGYNLARYISPQQYDKAIAVLFVFVLLTGGVQFILMELNLPVWGISSQRNYIAADLNLGKRVNGLIGEPKAFGVVSAMAFWFFAKRWIKLNKIVYLLLTLSSFFLLYRSGSANAYLAFVFTSLIYSLNKINGFKLFISFLLFSILSFSIVLVFKDYIFVRESHKLVIDSLLSGELDINIFDDLVKLVLAVWIEDFQYIIFGWGFGLIHFFSINHLDMATWFTIDHGYIDSNVGILSFISNFGIFGLTLLLCLIYRLLKIYSEDEKLAGIISLCIVPIIIGSPHVLPVFVTLGYLINYKTAKNQSIDFCKH